MVDSRSFRVPVTIEAELSVDGKYYEGVIENLSAEGFHFTTAVPEMPSDTVKGRAVELVFELPSEEKLTLECVVKWAGNAGPEGSDRTLGLEIIERSFEYDEFYMNTYSNYMGII